MQITKYFKEIKTRIFYILFSFVLTLVCAYNYWWDLIEIIAKPLEDAQSLYIKTKHDPTSNFLTQDSDIIFKNDSFHFMATELGEVFWAATRFSFFIALYLTFPFFLYQFWSFIIPGLYFYEKRFFKYFFILSFILTFINILMIYSMVLPLMCKFFLDFDMLNTNDYSFLINFLNNEPLELQKETLNVNLEFKISNYIELVQNTFLIGFLLLQIPTIIFIYILNKLYFKNSFTKSSKTFQQHTFITKNWRNFWYLLIILLSALLTPPDFLSQIILILFLLFLYEIIIYLMCFLIYKIKRRKNIKDTL